MVYLLFVGYIGQDRQCLDPERPGLLCDCVCLGLIGAGIDHHVGSFGGELQDCSTANIPPRTGHQGNFAIELTHAIYLLELSRSGCAIGGTIIARPQRPLPLGERTRAWPKRSFATALALSFPGIAGGI